MAFLVFPQKWFETAILSHQPNGHHMFQVSTQINALIIEPLSFETTV